MTATEMKQATIANLWSRLEALEYAADPRDQDEVFRLQDEISSRDRPWARLAASFEAAAEDERFGMEG